MINKLRTLVFVCSLFLCGCSASTYAQSSENTEDGTYNHSGHGCDAFAECGNYSVVPELSDFKETYESLNGKENSSKKIYRTITIAEDHPFVNTTEQEVIDRMDAGESFYLYIGDAKCPWCRAVIETAIAKAREYGVSEILYLPIWDEEGNEILRDKFELINGKVEQTVPGTEGYQELLKRFDSVLDDYTLLDGDTEIKVGEKRIYAPNYFRIENGEETITLVTGIPSGLDDPYTELTDSQLQEMSEIFEVFFR